jgi:hypothetical protein
METISLRKDFGLLDASDEIDIRPLTKVLQVPSVPHFTLDFTDCMVDYPTTAMVTDCVLEQIRNQAGVVRHLTCLFNYPLKLEYIINSLFAGSKVLSVPAERIPFPDLEARIDAEIRNLDLILTVSLVDKNGAVKLEKNYGKL